MEKHRKKAALCLFIFVIFFSAFWPIYHALRQLITEKSAFFYYYSPQILLDRPKEEDDMIFCQIYEKIEKIPKKNFYFNLITSSLLMPRKLELKNNKEKNVRLLSAFVNKKRLILDFSREFYTLNAQEEWNVVTSLLLLLNANTPQIEEIKIRVIGNDLQVLNGIFHYATPINIKKNKNDMFFNAFFQKKKAKKRRVTTIFGRIFDKNIIVTPC